MKPKIGIYLHYVNKYDTNVRFVNTARYMKRMWLFGLAMLAVVIGLVSGVRFFMQGKATPQVIRVRVADLPIVQSLPLYLAIEKGYFNAAGIEIERIPFQAPNQIIDALVSGQVDLTSPSGASGIMAIADSKDPGRFKIFMLSGGDKTIPNESLMVRNDSLLTSIQGLKGKTLGVVPGIQWRTITRSILRQAKLDPDKDVTLIEIAPNLQGQSLAAGQIDAVLALEPTPTIIKAKQIGRELVRGPAEQLISDPFYPGAGAIRADFVKDHPEVAKKIIEIFTRAVKEIQEHPEEARRYLKGYTPLDDVTISQVPILTFRMTSDIGQRELKSMDVFYDLFVEEEIVDSKIDFQKLLL